ncbi:MAG: DHH family phosphoesterase [Candidatus Hydrothermarchaeaceae archaeon]
MYIILGCGTAGHLAAKELSGLRREVTIVERDPERIKTLKSSGFKDIIKGDMTSEQTLKKAGLEGADAVLILTTDLDLNKKTVKAVRAINTDVILLVRAGVYSTEDEFKPEEADVVIYPSDVVAKYAVSNLDEIEPKKKLNKLRKIISEADKGIAIVTQNNPDPDAIASAVTLKRIIEKEGKTADIIYGEEIGHEENRALVNLMGIRLIHISKVADLRDYSKIALIEASIPGQNNPLNRDIVPDIIIDHHPVDKRQLKGKYVDIRPEIGATSTIMTQYLLHLGYELSEELSTLLLYGIKTDTQDFTRGATPADLNAVAVLYPRADHDLLAKIQAPLMSSDTLDALGAAIKNRRIVGSHLISNVGFIRDRDVLPQAADYLLKLEGVSTVLVYGIAKDVVHISSRNRDIRINLGEAMNTAFNDIGQAGGHSTAAAAKISLGLVGSVKDKGSLLRLVEEAVRDRFLKVVGAGDKGK